MKAVKELFFIFLITFFFAGVTTSADYIFQDKIAINEETRYAKYLLQVLDIPFPKQASPEVIAQIQNQQISEVKIRGKRIYRATNQDDDAIGYAFPIEGKGFWGNIKGILALNPELDTIKGIIFTQHSETPGLGARIDESWFRDQFMGIKIDPSLIDSPDPKFVLITKKDSEKQNAIDAITGASRTSSLLQTFLNKDIKAILSQKDMIRRINWPSQPAR